MLRQLSPSPAMRHDADFHGMPVRVTSFVHPLDARLLCVDCEASVTDSAGRTHCYFGHAAGADRAATEQRACAEILERLLASRVAFDTAQLAQPWSGRYLFRDGASGPFAPQRLLVREAVAEGQIAVSASGLGLHRQRERAIEHACLELVERHQLVSMWYGDPCALPLLRLGQPELLDEGYRLDYFSSADSIPLVLAVLAAPGQRGFFAGAAVRTDLAAAHEHARAEALQLAANFMVKGLFGDRHASTAWRGNVAANIERMAAMQGEAAVALHAHLARRVSTGAKPAVLTDWRAIVQAALPRADDISYVPLGSWGEFGAVRVIADGARSKNGMRRAWAGSGHLADPFC